MFGVVGAGVLALTACVGAPPSPDAIAGEFVTPIDPAWEVEVPGLYGDLVVREGVVLAYAVDDEVGMRLTAHSLDDGALLWERTSSPGGAYANPLLSSVNSASRPYPLPTISPLVVETRIDDEPVLAVVFFERDTESDSIRPDDFLHVADVHTGELLDVTAPDVDPEDFSFAPLGFHDDGTLFTNVYSPGYPCGEDEICWISEDGDTFDGYGSIRLDTRTLELRYAGGHIPEPDDDDTVTLEWGFDYAHVLDDDDGGIARYRDDAELWRIGMEELFEVPRTSPADNLDFTEVGDLVLIQGYQPILETLDDVHTLSIDYSESRTLVAVDTETGEVAWRLPGGDMLCHAVRERQIPVDAETIPICLATGGGYVYDLVADEYVRNDPMVASVAELTVADGELGWDVEGAGAVSLAHVVRLLDVTYAARGDLAVVEIPDVENGGLLDLRDGGWYPTPEEGVTYVCKAERDDVDLEFEGSAFAGGSNGITTGYPAGWYHYPCDIDGAETDVWTRGAVRVAAYSDPSSPFVVLPLDGSLIGFKLG